MKIVLGILGGFLLVIIVVGLIFFSMVKGTYNTLVTDKLAAQTQQADIDAQLQRRFDLINQMVGSTKGALIHEKQVFDDIAKQQAAFTQAQQTGDVQGELNANTAVTASVSQALHGYFVVQQQYPNEQALEFVKNLQVDIEGSENRVSVARQRYNDAVQTYNQASQVFPGNMIAGYFHFEPMKFYQEDAAAQKAPSVDLGQ